ncbi:ubiquinone/menaquinone biosynthesis methyltransferase [Allomyces macrogynus ATCC 38327]|uniref:2-methoxy-6-polyprenyl-1,4-benzoquinol methylase, mitochondrial n=1 Tax=Allomyces macrogynus (strain ATCC 38327) TaxID=578462 RepID=A0A0L0SQ00_ALLM3|nr:ubiquinone/menaquinone biosynthesis methyltransferase [Allomyces macrogynus ATCC 38327]|eukprot:KNE64445.1 ubiquinone/menaquinone biosynthesis methyltransferase [Allomyces macrogynus ATCC 38327]
MIRPSSLAAAARPLLTSAARATPATTAAAAATAARLSTTRMLRDQHDASGTTHFGFRTVREEDKESLVRGVFSSVADNYDLMNDAMSGGVHRCWKSAFIERLAPAPDTRLLDVAGGTGDIALRFLDYVREQNGGALGAAHVTVFDINPEMLRVGAQRFSKLGLENGGPHVSFVEGNAEELAGIEDNSMDAYTIAFGIRNCTHIDRVIRQAYRVLKPGGRFMVLEFGKVNNPLLSTLYDAYSFRVIPHLGQILANDRDSYQYLVESIRKFPTQQQFVDMMKHEGFQVVGQGYEDLTFGVATIWSGWKL